jgi:diguanylate cyclase (GGDEF)-like protein/PAS domain S-box-containing protein
MRHPKPPKAKARPRKKVSAESPPVATRYSSLSDADSLREFARNLGEGIYITTPEGRILDANPAFLEMFGARAFSDFAAVTAFDLFVDPKSRELELALMERDGRVREFEFQIRRLDGVVRWVVDTSYSVQDPDTGNRFMHGVLMDITARKDLEAELIELSTHDALTGCLNRRYFDQIAESFRCNPESRFGCVFVDIDNFKRYNDEHGHQEGDRVLVRMGRFLLRHVRAEEAVVRMGGDEFVIILVDADLIRTRHLSERLKQSALRSAPVPFSLGWASREAGESLSKLLERADRGLLNVRVENRTDEHRTR